MEHKKDIIIITAAGNATWLRERFTPGGWGRMLGEGLVGGYKEKMQALRSVDDRVSLWLGDIHGLVKQMRSAASSNRLVDVAILLHNLNNKFNQVKEVSGELKNLEKADTEPFDMEHKGYLPDGDLLQAEDGLSSEAGVWSDFKRRWVAKHMETEERRKRKMAIDTLVNQASTLADNVDGFLSQMSKARAAGNIGDYISILDKLSKEQFKFRAQFMPIYNRYLAPIVEKVKSERKAAEEENKLIAEKKKQELLQNNKEQEANPTQSAPSILSVHPTTPSVPELQLPELQPNVNTLHSPSAPTSVPLSGPGTTKDSNPPTIPDSVSDTIKDSKNPAEDDSEGGPSTLASPKAANVVEQAVIKHAHLSFVGELIKASKNDDPYLLSAMLIKYAEKIEDIDLEQSMSLLAIAEGILNA